MADSGISSLVLFIAAVTVAAGVAGTMTVAVQDISSSIDVRGDTISEDVRSDIDIISDTGSDAIYDDGSNTITLLVKNTGDNSIPPDAATIDVLVNGTYQPVSSVSTTDDAPDTWRPGEVATLQIDQQDLGAGEHRIVVHIRGNEDTVSIYES